MAGVPKAVHGEFIRESPVDLSPSGAGPVAAGTKTTDVALYVLEEGWHVVCPLLVIDGYPLEFAVAHMPYMHRDARDDVSRGTLRRTDRVCEV
jgi:hypothetical protein